MNSSSRAIGAALLTGSILLAGCATKPVWEHPTLAGRPNAADAAILAQAECDAYAAGRAPKPSSPVYMPVPAPTTYSTTGTYQNYGNTGSYTATTVARPNPASSFANGFNTGAAFGAAFAQAQAEKRARDISAACMRSLGWVDTSTPEGKAKFQQPTQAVAVAKQTTATQQIMTPETTNSAWLESMDYVKSYESVTNFETETVDGTKISVGSFDSPVFPLSSMIGKITEFINNPPKKMEDGALLSVMIIFDAIDCNTQKSAIMATFTMREGQEPKFIKYRTLEFETPESKSEQNDIKTYCAGHLGKRAAPELLPKGFVPAEAGR